MSKLARNVTSEAIGRAGAGASEEWKDEARTAISLLAGSQALLTTDDVWPLISQVDEPRALGFLMREAVVNGLITATDDFKVSSRIQCHQRPLRVWRSNVYVEVRQ